MIKEINIISHPSNWQNLNSLMIVSVNKDEEQGEFPYTRVLSIINMKGCMLCQHSNSTPGYIPEKYQWVFILKIPTRIICNGGEKKQTKCHLQKNKVWHFQTLKYHRAVGMNELVIQNQHVWGKLQRNTCNIL